MKCNTNKCSRFPVRKACLLAPCPFCSEPKPVPTPLNAPGNLRAMLPTINCPTHPYSKGFSGKANIHPKIHTPLSENSTKSGMEDSIGPFLFFSHNRETLFFLCSWQIPLDGQVSLSIHEPSKGICHNFFQGTPLVQTSPR